MKTNHGLRTIAVGVSAAAIFAALVALWLDHMRTAALTDAHAEVHVLAATLAQHTSRTFQAIEKATAPELQALAQPGNWRQGRPITPGRLHELVKALPAVAGIVVLDRDGRRAYATHPHLPGPTYGLPDFGIAAGQRQGIDDLLFAGAATPPGDHATDPHGTDPRGTDPLWLVRRIAAPDGQFHGVLAVAVHRSYMEELYRAAAAERATGIRLLRPDGSAVLTYHAATLAPARGNGGTEVTALQGVQPYALLLKVTLPNTAVLAGWSATAGVASTIAGIAAVLIGLLAALQARGLVARAQIRRQLAEQAGLLYETQCIAHVGSASYDPQTRRIHCSDEARRILGLDSGAAWARHVLLRHVHPADRGALLHAVLACRHGGHAEVEVRVGTPGRFERWAQLRTVGAADARSGIIRGAVSDTTERKAAETSRAQLAAIVESTDDAVMSYSIDGIILSWNRAAQRLFGYHPSDVIGRPVAHVLPPDQAADTLRLLDLAAAGRSVAHYDALRRSRRGADVHVALTVSPIISNRDRVTAASFLARDITAQKKSQMRRNVEHAVMRALLEGGTTESALLRVMRTLCLALGWDHAVRWRRDADHALVAAESWCSPSLAGTGMERATDDARVLLPHLAQRVWDTGWTLLRQDLPLDLEHPLPAPLAAAGLRCALVFPIKSPNGTVGVLQFLTRELPDTDAELLDTADMIGSQLGHYIERQRAEEERLAADARLHRIMANIPDAVFQFRRAPDGSLSFPFISERVADLYGEQAADVQRDYTLVFTPVRADHRRELLKSMLRSKRSGEPWRFETLVRTRNGTRRWLRGQASVSYGSDGSVYWDGVLSDITAQKRAALDILTLNEELEQRVADRTRQLEAINQELEAFSYSVSHDLRMPLRSVEGYTRLLNDQYRAQLDTNAQHYLERIAHAAQRMSELVDDLLKLARLSRSELKLAPVDLSAIAHEVCAALAEDTPERTVDLHIEDGVRVQGDASMLRIVLENLLGNAWKFTGHKDRPAIAFGTHVTNGEKAIFVRDNGAGFDMKRSHKLFGAFQRLHRAADFEGNGIGLATVKRIITLHGGRVWAMSVVNAGATFFFTLGTRGWR